MPVKIAGLSRRLVADTKGGVAIVTAFAIPVILGFSALALEYGGALQTKSKNQRISDIAAFAAAHAYRRAASATPNDRVSAGVTAAESIATLNGVSSGVSVGFDDPGDATLVDTAISEDKPIFLSRLLRPDDSVTINTTARVSLWAFGKFSPCILALGESSEWGFTGNGNAGTYDLTGCGVGSNSEIAMNGQTLQTGCAAPSFKTSDTCRDETKRGGFTDPLAGFTNWPNDNSDDSVCDFTGKFPDDMAVEIGSGGKGDYRLREGVLCVTEFGSFDSVVSDPDGAGNTVIARAGADLKMAGGHRNLAIIPSTNGDFEGVGLYAPASEITVSGNASFSIDRLSCFGIIANELTFNGNITLSAECGEDDPLYGAAGTGTSEPPMLIQ